MTLKCLSTSCGERTNAFSMASADDALQQVRGCYHSNTALLAAGGNSKKLRRFLSCPACGDGGSVVVTMVVGMRLRTRCASFGEGWRCSLTRARGGLDEYSEGARCFYGRTAKRPPIEAKTYVCRPRRPHDRLLHDAGPAAAAMSHAARAWHRASFRFRHSSSCSLLHANSLRQTAS